MATVVLSVRVDEALAGWVASYAEGRGVRKQVVLREAVLQFREVCGGGVPDLPAGAVVEVQSFPPSEAEVREAVAPAAQEEKVVEPAVPEGLQARRAANRRGGEYELPKIAPRRWA